MSKKLDKALAHAVHTFRPIIIDDIVKWEQDGEHPEARPWWSKEDIRDMCEYPEDYAWSPLRKTLLEELGLIFRHRPKDRSHGYSFAASPIDRAREVRYVGAQQIGSAKRMAWILEAGTALDALHRLDQDSLEAESLKLHDKHGVTLEQVGRAIEELDAKILTMEVLALLGAGG